MEIFAGDSNPAEPSRFQASKNPRLQAFAGLRLRVLWLSRQQQQRQQQRALSLSIIGRTMQVCRCSFNAIQAAHTLTCGAYLG
jgi:hypothetical protein